MITVNNLGMQFGGQWLFQHVDLQFLPGNCYGIIGANGAGKSTFLRILTGELESTTGSINVDPDKRVSVLKQNQNAYDEYTVLDTVIMGNQHLYDVPTIPGFAYPWPAAIECSNQSDHRAIPETGSAFRPQ